MVACSLVVGWRMTSGSRHWDDCAMERSPFTCEVYESTGCVPLDVIAGGESDFGACEMRCCCLFLLVFRSPALHCSVGQGRVHVYVLRTERLCDADSPRQVIDWRVALVSHIKFHDASGCRPHHPTAPARQVAAFYRSEARTGCHHARGHLHVPVLRCTMHSDEGHFWSCIRPPTSKR